jgi:hypothetical protein
MSPNYGVERRDEVIGRTDFDLSSPSLANQYRLDDRARRRQRSDGGQN